eukprot:350333-Chlamydomonas_euryale.AAC.3
MLATYIGCGATLGVELHWVWLSGWIAGVLRFSWSMQQWGLKVGCMLGETCGARRVEVQAVGR